MKRCLWIRLAALFLTFFLLFSVGTATGSAVNSTIADYSIAASNVLPVTVSEKNRMTLSQIATGSQAGINGDRGLYYGAKNDCGEIVELSYDPNNWDGCYYYVESNSILNIFPQNDTIIPSESMSPVSESKSLRVEPLELSIPCPVRKQPMMDGPNGMDCYSPLNVETQHMLQNICAELPAQRMEQLY